MQTAPIFSKSIQLQPKFSIENKLQNLTMNPIKILFRSIGQVMFQNNIYSGMLFLAGIFYNSWLLALAAVFGTIISNGFAQILKFPKDDIRNGIYGFNGTLVGIAVLCFFQIGVESIFAIVVGAALSTVLMHFLRKILPAFTAPFVLSTWLVVYSLLYLFKIPLLPSPDLLGNSLNLFSASSKSFGQVMFQNNVITGLFFALAIFINNKLNAVYAVYAAILGSLVGVFFSPISAINEGLMGYNAILCAIALSGKKWKDFVWITIAILLSTLLNFGLGTTGVFTLTAPFVLITWLVLGMKKKFQS